MRKLYWAVALIVGLQLIPWALLHVAEPLALVWLLVTAIYHLPLSWIGEPLFHTSEIGPHPTILGRLVTTATYLAILTIGWLGMGAITDYRHRGV